VSSIDGYCTGVRFEEDELGGRDPLGASMAKREGPEGAEEVEEGAGGVGEAGCGKEAKKKRRIAPTVLERF
jgi:hypothetical protein